MEKTKIFWLASNNLSKVMEMNDIFSSRFKNIIIKSMLDLNNISEIQEIEKTIEGNSLLKAKVLAQQINKITIADDSGLEIQALNNFPGVISKRWALPETNSNKINELLLIKCNKLHNKNARLKTVITYYNPKTLFYKQFTGILDGKIHNKIEGNNGFGYDSIFYLGEVKKTLAQLTSEQKNKISQRFKAIDQFLNWLEKEKEIER